MRGEGNTRTRDELVEQMRDEIRYLRERVANLEDRCDTLRTEQTERERELIDRILKRAGVRMIAEPETPPPVVPLAPLTREQELLEEDRRQEYIEVFMAQFGKMPTPAEIADALRAQGENRLTLVGEK